MNDVIQGKLLVVEDVLTTQRIYRAILERAGYEVSTATDYDQAIALADSSIDLALVDISLIGGKSGIEVLKFIRQHHPNCPVIMMSAFADKRNVIESLREGAADYLEKPVELDELPQIVQRWLSYRLMQKENVRLQDYQSMHDAIQQSESHFQAIFQASPTPLAMVDGHGDFKNLNKAFIEATGYTLDDIPAMADWWLRAYPNVQYRQWMVETWQENMEIAMRTNSAFAPIELNIRCKDGTTRIFSVAAVPLQKNYAENYLVVLHDITIRKAAEEEINHLAYYDNLTGLPNRLLLLDRMQKALASSARSNRKGALLFIDMDNFKKINDTLGHDIGDLLLQQITQRLQHFMREGDTVARLGGDEFAVLLLDLSEDHLEAAAQTKNICDKILAKLNHAYQLGNYEHRCTASIGATLYDGHQLTAEELIKQADIALHQAKKSGPNELRFYDPEMQRNITSRAMLEDDLNKALLNQEFHLYYQIQVDDLNRPLGAETLIRWIHPTRGFVSPAQFIPLAEETGLILPIGLWVLEKACAQLKAWQLEVHTRELVLAVNVSARQFRQENFVAQVHSAIQMHDINSRLLKLELTESMLVDNVEEIIVTMHALKEIGVQFSMDDFGTGYSSLQYLKRLPLDQLKIDQSFVKDMATDASDNSIVQTIIAMAKKLKLDVIAEGVELETQRQLLASYGCHRYQGYLFSKPVPIDQFEALLKRC